MDDSWTVPAEPRQAFGDLGPIQASTSVVSLLPRLKPRSAPPRVKLLIADLGLRYRPSAASDLEAHAHLIGLLTLDLADIPHDRLERAIDQWVRTEKWMPKASDLVEICQRHQHEECVAHPAYPKGYDPARAFCEQRNAAMSANETGRKDIEWYVTDAGEPKLRNRLSETGKQSVERVAPHDVDRLNRALRKFNAPFRYDRDGYDFDLPVGSIDPTDPSTT